LDPDESGETRPGRAGGQREYLPAMLELEAALIYLN
jgi:hypothetical protein